MDIGHDETRHEGGFVLQLVGVSRPQPQQARHVFKFPVYWLRRRFSARMMSEEAVPSRRRTTVVLQYKAAACSVAGPLKNLDCALEYVHMYVPRSRSRLIQE